MAGRGKRSRSLEQVRSYYRRILPFYELESARREDLAFWLKQVRRLKPRAILELGTGLGRVLSVVAPESRNAFGVDISFEMLSRAAERLETAGGHLVGGDMRELPFARGFDLVIAPSDPFSHLLSTADRRAALREVARVLAPGGLFILDALHRTGRRFEHTRRLALSDGTLTIRESWRRLSGKDLWNACYLYRRRNGNPAGEAEAQFTARAWKAGDLRAFFASCGLAVQKLWGTFSRAPFTKRSRRLIVLARPARFVQRKTARKSEE